MHDPRRLTIRFHTSINPLMGTNTLEVEVQFTVVWSETIITMQTTVFLNTQSFSTETTNPSMPLTAFIFQTTTLYNVAIAQTTYDSD